MSKPKGVRINIITMNKKDNYLKAKDLYRYLNYIKKQWSNHPEVASFLEDMKEMMKEAEKNMKPVKPGVQYELRVRK
jgi:hypothetical protein